MVDDTRDYNVCDALLRPCLVAADDGDLFVLVRVGEVSFEFFPSGQIHLEVAGWRAGMLYSMQTFFSPFAVIRRSALA